MELVHMCSSSTSMTAHMTMLKKLQGERFLSSPF